MPNALVYNIQKAIERRPDDVGAYVDLVDAYDNLIRAGRAYYHADNKALRGQITAVTRRLIESGASAGNIKRLNDAYWHSMLVDAPVDFDAYCQYIERARDPKKRFYLPRRKQLLRVVNSLQKLMDDELDLLGISLPPGVGKSTLAIFLLTWVAGR